MRPIILFLVVGFLAGCAKLNVENSADIIKRDFAKVVSAEAVTVKSSETRSKRALIGGLAALANPLAVIPIAIVAGVAVEDGIGQNQRYKTTFETKQSEQLTFIVSRKFNAGSCILIAQRSEQPPLLVTQSASACN